MRFKFFEVFDLPHILVEFEIPGSKSGSKPGSKSGSISGSNSGSDEIIWGSEKLVYPPKKTVGVELPDLDIVWTVSELVLWWCEDESRDEWGEVDKDRWRYAPSLS